MKANPSPTLSVDQNTKTTGGTFAGKSNQNPASIGFKLAADTLTKEMYITLHPEGSNGKDIRDAYRLLPFNSATFLEFYSTLNNGTELSINNLSQKFGTEITVPIHVGGFKEGRPLNGNYTISWPEFGDIPSEWSLTLEDTELNKSVNIRETESYEFDLNQSAGKIFQANTIENFRLINETQKGKAKSSNEDPRFLLLIDPGADAGDLPEKFELYHNFPNPFNPSTTIRFAVPIESPIELRVYDVLGREVAELANRRFDAGFHRIKWDAGGLSSGSYFVRLKTNKGVFTNKMTLIK